jgi:hypothetical protein
MRQHIRIVALVCIAVFAFTAISAMWTLAMFDAETQVPDLFAACATDRPIPLSEALPSSPPIRIASPRGPPTL